MIHSPRQLEPAFLLAALLLPLAAIGDWLFSKTDWNFTPDGNPRIRRKGLRRKFLRQAEPSRPASLSASLAKWSRSLFGRLGLKSRASGGRRPQQASSLPFSRKRKSISGTVLFLVGVLIVGGALIGLAAFGLIPGITDVLNKIGQFFGVTFGFIPSEKVEASVNALACAINIVAASNTHEFFIDVDGERIYKQDLGVKPGATLKVMKKICSGYFQPETATGGFLNFLNEIPSKISGFLSGAPTGKVTIGGLTNLDERTRLQFGKDGGKPHVVCEAEGGKCAVEGFELPQTILTHGPIGGVIDFGKAWIHAMGDPQNIIYYETFPRGVEQAWTYTGWDVILSMAALGGLLNLGGGGGKVVGTVIKQGVLVLTGRTTAQAAKRAITIKAIKEFGGRKAAERFIGKTTSQQFADAQKWFEAKMVAAVFGRDIDPAIEALLKRTLQVQTRVFGRELAPVLEIPGITAAQKDLIYGDIATYMLTNLDDKIDEEALAQFIKDRVRERTGFFVSLGTERRADLARGANDIRDQLFDGRLAKSLSSEDRFNLFRSVASNLRKEAKNSIVEQLEKSMEKASTIRNNLRKLVGAKAIREDVKKNIDKRAEELLELNWGSIERSFMALPDDDIIIEGVTIKAKSNMIKVVEDAIDGKLDSIDRDFLLSRVNALQEASYGWLGVPAKGLSRGFTDRQRARLMLAVLAISGLAVLTQAQADKYETREPNSLVISFPWFLDIARNKKAIPLAEPVKNFFVAVQQPTLTGISPERFYTVSPCKTDMKVESGSISCSLGIKSDEYGIVFQTARLAASGAGAQAGKAISFGISAPCSWNYMLDKDKEIFGDVRDYNTTGSVKLFGLLTSWTDTTTSPAAWTCDTDKVYTINKDNPFDISEGKAISLTTSGRTNRVFTGPSLLICPKFIPGTNTPLNPEEVIKYIIELKGILKKSPDGQPFFPFGCHPTPDGNTGLFGAYAASIINARSATNTKGEDSSDLMNICEHPKEPPFVFRKMTFDKAILVTEDRDSMAKYKQSDKLDTNYCVTSHGKPSDLGILLVNAGAAILSFVAFMFGGPIAAPILFFVIGSTTTIGEQVIGEANKWPSDQFARA